MADLETIQQKIIIIYIGFSKLILSYKRDRQ